MYAPRPPPIAKKREPGKNLVLLTAFILNLVALVLIVVAFCTPYWVVSWPRVFNEFEKLGLWEACFRGLVLDWDITQKAYHGCWWTLAEEFIPIRAWLMPPWFVTTQVLVTLSLVAQVINVAFLGLMYSKARAENVMGQVGAKRQPFFMVQASTYLTIIIAFVMSFTIMLFAGCYYWDKNWMPRRDLTYPGLSYGLAVLSAFFSVFASIAIGNYNTIIREEYRELPSRPALDLSILGPRA